MTRISLKLLTICLLLTNYYISSSQTFLQGNITPPQDYCPPKPTPPPSCPKPPPKPTPPPCPPKPTPPPSCPTPPPKPIPPPCPTKQTPPPCPVPTTPPKRNDKPDECCYDKPDIILLRKEIDQLLIELKLKINSSCNFEDSLKIFSEFSQRITIITQKLSSYTNECNSCNDSNKKIIDDCVSSTEKIYQEFHQLIIVIIQKHTEFIQKTIKQPKKNNLKGKFESICQEIECLRNNTKKICDEINQCEEDECSYRTQCEKEATSISELLIKLQSYKFDFSSIKNLKNTKIIEIIQKITTDLKGFTAYGSDCSCNIGKHGDKYKKTKVDFCNIIDKIEKKRKELDCKIEEECCKKNTTYPQDQTPPSSGTTTEPTNVPDVPISVQPPNNTTTEPNGIGGPSVGIPADNTGGASATPSDQGTTTPPTVNNNSTDVTIISNPSPTNSGSSNGEVTVTPIDPPRPDPLNDILLGLNNIA